MDESLTQPCRVQEDGLMGCKLLLGGEKVTFANVFDGTAGISIG
jgi:hypothetical protein